MSGTKKVNAESIPEVSAPVPEKAAAFADELKQLREAKYYSDEALRKAGSDMAKAERARETLKKSRDRAKEKDRILLSSRQQLLASIADHYLRDISDPDELAVRMVELCEASMQSGENDPDFRGDYPTYAQTGKALTEAVMPAIRKVSPDGKLTWFMLEQLTDVYLPDWTIQMEKVFRGEYTSIHALVPVPVQAE